MPEQSVSSATLLVDTFISGHGWRETVCVRREGGYVMAADANTSSFSVVFSASSLFLWRSVAGAGGGMKKAVWDVLYRLVAKERLRRRAGAGGGKEAQAALVLSPSRTLREEQACRVSLILSRFRTTHDGFWRRMTTNSLSSAELVLGRRQNVIAKL